MTQYSEAEVAKHNTPADCWIIINTKVYDVTKFLEEHPGGKKVVLRVAGKDASKEFSKFHNVAAILQKYGPQLEIGEVGTGGATEKQQPIKQDLQEKKEKPSPFGTGFFGDLVPYSDPNWYQGWNSPYYNESHHKFRAAMREIVERDWKPHVEEWEAAKEIPREMLRKAYEAGWLAGFIGPPWPTQYVGTHIAGGIDPKEFNAFHELILQDELSRIGSGGVVGALFGGLSIGLPPILHFGSKYLQDKVCKPCLTGEKIICLAITEPGAGSDVAQLKTEAKKSACGKFYIVNGEKKWITNGIWADFFTVAVRTGGEGMGGVSMILIEKNMPGVKTRRMDCQGAVPSGTTYVTFEDVQVPVENLIGEENKGFKYIMYNFNHERWAVIVEASRFARVCVEEAFTYAHKRKTFGKRLIDHPVIRLKLAHMIRQVEATHAAIENITYQLTTMKRSEANMKIGGAMALLKVQATTTFEFCAREASQIFGGLAYTKGGQGGKVERLYREVRAYSIFAGSEEIMVDLGVRQAMKMYEMAKNFGISSGNSKL